jgi:hypothetical protein
MRMVAGLLALGLLGLGLWQVRPVLVWHLTVAPEIERMGRSHRVDVETQRLLPAPDPGWPRLRTGRLDLRAPLDARELGRCADCGDGCRLELRDASGWLAVFEGGLRPYPASVHSFAPSSDDISLWRPRAANWLTVEALATRAHLSPPPHETFRFETDSSRGIVSRVVGRGGERFVVYAFAPDGSPGGTLAVSRAGLPVVRRMLGGLVVGDRVPASRCDGAAGS